MDYIPKTKWFGKKPALGNEWGVPDIFKEDLRNRRIEDSTPLLIIDWFTNSWHTIEEHLKKAAVMKNFSQTTS